MGEQSPRGGQGHGPSGTDGDQTVVRLDEVARAGKEVGVAVARHDELRLQPPQRPVGPPVFYQFDGGPLQVSPIFLQLGFKSGEKSEGVGGRSRESRQNSSPMEFAEFSP